MRQRITATIRRLVARLREDAGTSVVEFVFVLPVIFVMFVGALLFAQAMYAQFTVVNAAREASRVGAEVGIQDGEDALIVAKELAEDRAKRILDDARLPVSDENFEITFPDSEEEHLKVKEFWRGRLFMVRIRYEYALAASFLQPLNASEPIQVITLESTSMHRIPPYKARWQEEHDEN